MKLITYLSVALISTATLSTRTLSSPAIINHAEVLADSAYKLHSKTAQVENVDFKKNNKSKDKVLYIKIGNSGEVKLNNNLNNTAVQGGQRYKKVDESVPEFESIKILSGKYEDIKVERSGQSNNVYTLTGLTFPLRLELHTGKEVIDMEVIEAGKWNININLKNN